jgi:hypothetical protein
VTYETPGIRATLGTEKRGFFVNADLPDLLATMFNRPFSGLQLCQDILLLNPAQAVLHVSHAETRISIDSPNE